jgi:hypothetical protein
MSLRLVSFGFTAALLLIAGAPAFADDSNASIQNAESVTVITGHDNTVNSSSTQTIDNNRRAPGSTGVSQTTRTNTDIQGSGNYVRKTTTQRSGNFNR